MLYSNPRLFTVTFIASSLFTVLPAVGQVINEDFKLLASDGSAGDLFSYSISIDNGVIAVGAYGDANGIGSGSAYLFDASSGTQIAKLLPSDGGRRFGRSVAIDNGIVAVGDFGNDDNGIGSGSAYLFDASTGAQLFKLLPIDGAADDNFGISIDINNGIVAIGAFLNDDNGNGSGSAYLFDASTGAQLFKLLPIDGAAGDAFGWSVAIDNGVVAVGAYGDDDNGSGSGSAYLFDASTGAQIAKLHANDGAGGDWFGGSVAIDNGIVAVGAPYANDNGNFSGSAYLFDVSNGLQIAKLLPTDGAVGDVFGYSIAIEDGVIAAGAYSDTNKNIRTGSAYLFDASTGEQITKLLPSDASAFANFGISIAINNSTVAIGAPFTSENGDNSGSAYLFTAPSTCPADLTGEGVLDFFDISAFLSAFVSQNPIADFTGDGIFDFFDVSAFLGAFGAGCP